MKINKKRCIGCKKCNPYCTVGAISIVHQKGKKKSEVDQSVCVECGACLRSEICPKDAIFLPELKWPRIVRAQFGNPYFGHPAAKKGVPPPPEIKLNDVTGRIKSGITDVVVEMGRPGISTSFADVQTVCMALAEEGVTLEPGGPVAAIMNNLDTGKLKSDVLKERALNVMIHFRVDNHRLSQSLKILKQVADKIDTVFSLSLVNRVEKDGRTPAVPIAAEAGYKIDEHAKANVGLGKRLEAVK